MYWPLKLTKNLLNVGLQTNLNRMGLKIMRKFD